MQVGRTLLLHGWGGSDLPHWQAWLAGKLAQEYGTVAFPLLDNPHFPNKNRWVAQAFEAIEMLQPANVVCHSLGCILWFWLCGQKLIEVEHLILVAPPSLKTQIDTIDTFFPLSAPKNLYAKRVDLIASSNDPYISSHEANTLAKSINANPNPMAFAIANTTLSIRLYSFLITRIATPRIAQLVVIRGKNTPSAWYRAGLTFLRMISTICTRDAITNM